VTHTSATILIRAKVEPTQAILYLREGTYAFLPVSSPRTIPLSVYDVTGARS
jgi:hypothetical protein